jgi:2-oxoglutarate ferredoxin oxidoreductase subunit delta
MNSPQAAADSQGGPVQLDLGLCKACGICTALCPENVFDETEMGEPIIARPEDCTSCLLCELHCPDFAIEVRRRAKKGAAAATDDEGNEQLAGRVYAALAAKPKGDADDVNAEEPCAPAHEEH